MSALTENILLKVCSKIMDEVTTTDELIPSGETASYRSNPLGLAEFTLSRRDPAYVERSKGTDRLEKARTAGKSPAELEPELTKIYDSIKKIPGMETIEEQAASCQRVIGGLANITREYATKRYRSNVINWGMLPFQMKEEPEFETGDYIFVPGVRTALESGNMSDITAYVMKEDSAREIHLYITDMTQEEREIVKAGSLINYNRKR